MVRSGALTLGAFLSLGAFSSAEAQDAFAFSAVSPTSLAGVLPYLPQNWSDLPVQFNASEAVGYNSNVSNTPFNNGNSLLGFKPIGTFEIHIQLRRFNEMGLGRAGVLRRWELRVYSVSQ